MGIEPFLVSSSILGVLAQRLLRTICPKCKEEYTSPEGSLKDLDFSSVGGPMKFYRGRGCPSCKNIGLWGRSGIFELMVVDEQISRGITDRLSTQELREMARKAGMRTLREMGLAKAVSGVTTLEEVLHNT
jgi:type II secretory ATPase GspE/PulE/Tfp pilus assembly ATPase PilB-like protein